MDPDDLAVLAQVLRTITRRCRLSRADAEDFAQCVQLRLVERNYDIFRRFSGRSSLRTYLTVVVLRMLLDWRNAMYGKWRPSAAATRLGKHAVLLERLVHRDGYTRDEAVHIVGLRNDAPPTTNLMHIAAALPPRERRLIVSDEALRCIGEEFRDPLEATEHTAAARRIGAALAAALRLLPEPERRLIYLRYAACRSVKEIAQMLQIEPKVLYRRFDATLRRLRRQLIAAGITDPVL